jgi:6-pyruvoyltetrahydropterin/6-carboxytetrahydropterin synthase
MKVRLTREFSFEMAHTLVGYDGMCSQIHGHSYRLFVTVRGVPLTDPASPKDGMLMDFGQLKAIVNRTIVERYDHTLLLRASGMDRALIESLRGSFERVEVLDWQPTCENLVARFAALLQPRMPNGVELFSLRLHETANSFAEWFAGDQ